MNDDGVFNVGPLGRLLAVPVDGGGHAAALQGDVEGRLSLSYSGRNVDTVGVPEVALAKNQTVKGPIETDPDPHHVLLTLDLEVLDLGHVGRLGYLPGVIGRDGLQH